jgi:anti-sigma regulatory factor (Ser/Thr protein kinase)
VIDKRLKLVLASKPESIEEIRNEIKTFLSETVFEQRIQDILLTASEAGTNVVRHAYENCVHTESEQIIIVECVLHSHKLTIFVRDRGCGLRRKDNRNLFTEEGGFGLYLMKELADKFTHHPAETGTIVELGFECEPLQKKSIFGPVSIVTPRAIRAYARIKSFTVFVNGKTAELAEVLAVGDYDSANKVLDDIIKQANGLNCHFSRLTPRTRQVVKGWLESSVNTLRRLEQGLIQNESSIMTSGSGVYEMIRQRETINILSEIVNDLESVYDGHGSCWIALDDGPLQLI